MHSSGKLPFFESLLSLHIDEEPGGLLEDARHVAVAVILVKET